MNRSNEEENRRNGAGLLAAGVIAVGSAALAGALYWLTSGSNKNEVDAAQAQSHSQSGRAEQRTLRENNSRTGHHHQIKSSSHSRTSSSQLKNLNTERMENSANTWTYHLTHLINGLSIEAGNSSELTMKQHTQQSPIVTNINSLLSDIYVKYIQLRPEDFQMHYRLFDSIFMELHKNMKAVDPYYGRYSSTVQFAGSHYDKLRITKPDEFDMDVVIDLPLNLNVNVDNPQASDIVIEPKAAGFLQLRMGHQFQRLPMRDGIDWQINKTAYNWKDDNNFLLRSNFIQWFRSVVDKALNKVRLSGVRLPVFYVDGIPYTVRLTESGPAVTLIVENISRGFKMDVDLVPALKFPESRWPIGPNYRQIPAKCQRGHWMVVPKPIKGYNEHDTARSWRLALHNQERELMYNSYNLRQTIRLIKKLRDALGMKKIASYYVKTLFFWEIVEKKDEGYWKTNNPATLFKVMVKRLYAALLAGKIPYFWNKSNNLIEHIDRNTLCQYMEKLAPLIKILDAENSLNQKYKEVAQFLLVGEELAEYRSFLDI